ncbi:hypothetical protein [Helicobacter suis]|uniref:hypothetical protein n=1 Tax=Helicobacter suis TaxID=104628 RepID=UPI0013D1C567|nr:hypothetical protein [Helicobacter suis]
MKNLPDMDNYSRLLKITFVDGDIWENVKLDGYDYAPVDLQEDEADMEDELSVTYNGIGITLKASEIQKIESQPVKK